MEAVCRGCGDPVAENETCKRCGMGWGHNMTTERPEDQPADERIGTLLKKIVQEMVDEPDAVKVKHEKGENTHIYEITVADADRGKLIGKSGQNITAIRHLLKTWVPKYGIRAVISINE